MANTNLASQAYVAYGFGVLCLLAAFLLWCFPMATANRIVPRTGFGNRLELRAFDAARVGGSLIGLWFFANAIPGILWFLFRGAAYATGPGQSIVGALAIEDKIRLAFYAVQLVLSFALIFKSHVFASIATRKTETPEGGV